MTEPTTCTAITKSGNRCSHGHGLQSGLCIFHDPERKDQLRAMRSAGAKASTIAREANRHERLAMLAPSAGPRPPVGNSLEEIGAFLRWCVEAGVRGELPRADLVALTNSARTLQAIYEKRDLESALRAARRDLDKLKRAAR